MYESYYGFTKTPFTKDISPSQLFSHNQHEEALARLSYVVKERAIAVLTGEVGSGKSVALRSLSSNLDESRNTVVYFFGLAGLRGFYSELVVALGGTPRFLKAHLIAQAKDLIAQETEGRKKNLVVIIDEAHVLEPNILDEIRLLTNSQMDSASSFSLILSGQPMLGRKLKLSSLLALSQRVALRCQLKGLNLEETAGYVRHHLTIAGRSDAMFSDDAVALIHSFSAGIPRRINNICAHSLVAGFLDKKSIIDEATVRQAVAELQAD
ncbi:MAG: AAA family ATPase [Actinobacteria bacterium]|nr:AAA family ATPase [Actinomycetota bacterium]